MYYESFKKFWVPILKKQYFKLKLTNDINGILDLKENIWNNWHFSKEERNAVLKEIGIVE